MLTATIKFNLTKCFKNQGLVEDNLSTKEFPNIHRTEEHEELTTPVVLDAGKSKRKRATGDKFKSGGKKDPIVGVIIILYRYFSKSLKTGY